MATNTPNLNLVKPELDDWADIRVLNGNMDILDDEISKLKINQEYLPLTGGTVTGDLTVNGNFTNGKFINTNDTFTYDGKEIIRLIEYKESSGDITAVYGLADGLTYNSRTWRYSDGSQRVEFYLDAKVTGQYGTVVVNFDMPFSDNNYGVGSVAIKKIDNNVTSDNYEDIMYAPNATHIKCYLGTSCNNRVIINGRWK